MKLLIFILAFFTFNLSFSFNTPNPLPLKLNYLSMNANSIIKNTGLLFFDAGLTDTLGKGFEFGIGFPLYTETISQSSRQIYCFGLNAGYCFKPLRHNKISNLGFKIKSYYVSSLEYDRNDFYQKNNYIYDYTFAKIYFNQLSINPIFYFKRQFYDQFHFELSIGTQLSIEKLRYRNVLGQDFYIPHLGSSNKIERPGWHKTIRPFIGTSLIYQFKS
jgi:hypothetical protein